MRGRLVASAPALSLACGGLLFGGLVLGCQSSSTAAETPESTSGAEAASDGTRGARVVSSTPDSPTNGQIHVRVEAARGGQRIPFTPGSGLRSGDRFVVFVRADRSLYVHVVQFFPDGTSTLLSSADGQPVFVNAGVETRLPPLPSEIELDSATGEENIYVIASPSPLDHIDAALSQLVADVHASAQESPPPSTTADTRPGPTGASGPGRPASTPPRTGSTRPASPASRRARPDLLAGLSRGARVVPATSAVEATADDRGVVVARITFTHLP